MQTAPPPLGDKTKVPGADGKDYATIIGGETILASDTNHDETVLREPEKTVLPTSEDETLVSPGAAADKLESRVELLSKKLRGKIISPTTMVEPSMIAPTPPTIEGTRTADTGTIEDVLRVCEETYNMLKQ